MVCEQLMGESVDIIDYTLLRKKGILQRAQASSRTTPSSAPSNPLASLLPVSSSTPSPAASPSEGLFGFMDTPSSAPVSSSSASSSFDSASLSALQIKVDDLDYKMGKLTEQIALLEAKLGLVGSSS